MVAFSFIYDSYRSSTLTLLLSVNYSGAGQCSITVGPGAKVLKAIRAKHDVIVGWGIERIGKVFCLWQQVCVGQRGRVHSRMSGFNVTQRWCGFGKEWVGRVKRGSKGKESNGEEHATKVTVG